MPALFPIRIDVEEAFVGPILRLLNKRPGVAGIHLDFDEVGKSAKPAGQNGRGHSRKKKDPSAPSAKSIIITELMTGAKNLDYLRAKFTEHGMSSGNVSSTLFELQQKGITQNIATGVHALTAEAMEKLQAEQAQQHAPALPPPSSEKHDRSKTRPFVLQSIKDGLPRSEIVAKGESLGINERMIDAALTRLKHSGEIEGTTTPGKFKIIPARRSGKNK